MLFELTDIVLIRDGRRLLDGFSARIEPGATAIVGPSGVGKSSLLRLLNRLADPDRGRISYRGTPLTELDPLELRRDVMLVPQLPALQPGTVGSNIAFATALGGGNSTDPEQAVRAAGLSGEYLGRDVDRLSVGEQQRAMLARALAVEPSVLLLDEPTSALDAEATAAVERALLGLRERSELSLILVTHDPAQAGRLTSARIELAGAPAPDPAEARR